MNNHRKEIESIYNSSYYEKDELAVPHKNNFIKYVVVVNEESEGTSLNKSEHGIEETYEVCVAVLQLWDAASNEDNAT